MSRKQKIIPHIPATMNEVLKALLQPNYDIARKIRKEIQKNERLKKNNAKVKK